MLKMWGPRVTLSPKPDEIPSGAQGNSAEVMTVKQREPES